MDDFGLLAQTGVIVFLIAFLPLFKSLLSFLHRVLKPMLALPLEVTLRLVTGRHWFEGDGSRRFEKPNSNGAAVVAVGG